ncbi:MAG: YnbE family lipoprotein [Janthinobacterium lividum]|uniref:YnbE family lipoprotein n=1 Tax=unclassified Brevundimonas TaxID=2622653 RepID=UPI0025BA6F5C|nr:MULTISPECIES: YnbE family lipoprotein [unclassified Brevundimonas]
MINKRQFAAAVIGTAMLGGAACTPTVKVSFDQPLVINANLTADIRIRLDKELQDLIRENPNLF